MLSASFCFFPFHHTILLHLVCTIQTIQVILWKLPNKNPSQNIVFLGFKLNLLWLVCFHILGEENCQSHSLVKHFWIFYAMWMIPEFFLNFCSLQFLMQWTVGISFFYKYVVNNHFIISHSILNLYSMYTAMRPEFKISTLSEKSALRITGQKAKHPWLSIY